MSNYTDFFEDEYRYALSHVEYNRHFSGDDKPTTVSFVAKDSYVVSSRSEREIHVAFNRYIGYNPVSNFDIMISFDMAFTLKKAVSSDSIDDSDIIRILKESQFTTEMISKSSLLISQLTMIGNLNPMILPPNYISNAD